MTDFGSYTDFSPSKCIIVSCHVFDYKYHHVFGKKPWTCRSSWFETGVVMDITLPSRIWLDKYYVFSRPVYIKGSSRSHHVFYQFWPSRIWCMRPRPFGRHGLYYFRFSKTVIKFALWLHLFPWVFVAVCCSLCCLWRVTLQLSHEINAVTMRFKQFFKKWRNNSLNCK